MSISAKYKAMTRSSELNLLTSPHPSSTVNRNFTLSNLKIAFLTFGCQPRNPCRPRPGISTVPGWVPGLHALALGVTKGYSPAVASAWLLARPGGGSGSASLLVPSGDRGGPSSLRRAVEGWVPLRGMVAGAEGKPGASQPVRAAGRAGKFPAGPRPVPLEEKLRPPVF